MYKSIVMVDSIKPKDLTNGTPEEQKKEFEDLQKKGVANLNSAERKKFLELGRLFHNTQRKPIESLKKDLEEAFKNGDFDAADKINQEIEKLEQDSKSTSDNLDNIFADNELNNLGEDKKDVIRKFILEEIRKQQNTQRDNKQEIINNQSEIDRLTDQLNKEKTINNDLLTDTPSLREYYSFERRRLSSTLKKFDKFRKEKEKYPKNLLIYAMGITNTKIFGTRQKLKRGRITLAWKWKEDDIVSNLKVMLEKLKPDSGEKSKWKEAIKAALYKEIDIALKAHVEKLIEKNSLPPRK